MLDVKNYAVAPTDKLLEQVEEMANSIAYGGSKIRIMPDGHPGVGAVVGSTISFTDKLSPSSVGVDVCCSVSAFRIVGDYDVVSIDEAIHKHVPSGFSVRNKEAEESVEFPYESLRCWDSFSDAEKHRIRHSMGTLGGGKR